MSSHFEFFIYQILCDNDWLGVIKTLNENENEVFTPIYCFLWRNNSIIQMQNSRHFPI